MNKTDELAVVTAAHDRTAETPIAGTRASAGRFLFSGSSHPPLVRIVSRLRWVIPFLIGLIGAAYMFLEQAILQGHSVTSYHVIRSVLVIGLVGPVIPWLILTWAMHIAEAEAWTQHELETRNRGLAALNAVGEVAGESLHLESILHAALEKMIDLMGMDIGEMRMIEDGQLVLKAHHGISQVLKEERQVPIGKCLCGRCAGSGVTLTVNNPLATSALAKSLCAQEGFQSIISVPIQNRGKVLGVVMLGGRKPNQIDLPDQRILSAIAQRLAAAVENAQLYQQASRRALHLQTASLVGQRMITLLELDPLVTEVVTMIKEKFSYDHVHLFLVDEATREIVLKEASGGATELARLQKLRLKIGKEGITGWVAYSGQTVVCNDVSREPRYYPIELLPETKSELAVPLRVGSRIIGVLDVQCNRCDAFDKEDVTILQILGNQIGIAIRNAQLYQETKQRYEAMVALHEISLDMIAELDAELLLQALLRRGAQLLGAEGGTLFLYDEKQGIIRNVASYNTWKDFVGMTLRLGEGLVGRVIQTGTPMIENNYDSWEGKSPSFAGTPQSRIVSAPLKWKERVIGGINILNNVRGRAFQENDIWLLTHFADLASIAIQNAELHTQIKEFSSSLELTVERRTEELSRAKAQILVKAEQLRSLLANTIDLQESERARIARDMHDGVVQMISAASFEIQAAKALAVTGEVAAVRDKLDTAQHALKETEVEIRRSIYDLHPPILDAVGLAPAVQKYTQRFQSLSGIQCRLQAGGTPYRLPQAAEIALFRVVQQALQNVAAHANAEQADITMNYGPHLLSVRVQDNGSGFDYRAWMEGQHKNHLGLAGMHERIENLGGKMEVWSEPGQGTRLTFELPIVQDEEEED